MFKFLLQNFYSLLFFKGNFKRKNLIFTIISIIFTVLSSICIFHVRLFLMYSYWWNSLKCILRKKKKEKKTIRIKLITVESACSNPSGFIDGKRWIDVELISFKISLFFAKSWSQKYDASRNRSSLPTGSFPCIFPIYFISGFTENIYQFNKFIFFGNTI